MLLVRNPVDDTKFYGAAFSMGKVQYSTRKQQPSELILFSISVQAILLLYWWDFSATELSLNERREYFQKRKYPC